MVFSQVSYQRGTVNIPTNGTDFSFFSRDPSFQAILTQALNIGSHNLEGELYLAENVRAE